jgi:hypothetical protein
MGLRNLNKAGNCLSAERLLAFKRASLVGKTTTKIQIKLENAR